MCFVSEGKILLPVLCYLPFARSPCVILKDEKKVAELYSEKARVGKAVTKKRKAVEQ